MRAPFYARIGEDSPPKQGGIQLSLISINQAKRMLMNFMCIIITVVSKAHKIVISINQLFIVKSTLKHPCTAHGHPPPLMYFILMSGFIMSRMMETNDIMKTKKQNSSWVNNAVLNERLHQF